MANTYAIYEGDNSTTSFAIPFSNYLQESHIIVRQAGTNYDSDTAGDYSFSVSGGNVVFDVAPASGVLFYILRDTLGKDSDSTALLYDFSDGSILTADQQDDVYRQNFYLSQEALDRVPMYDSGWTKTFDTSLGGSAALAASTTLHLLTPTDYRSLLPLKTVELMWRNSSESEVHYFPPHAQAIYDHSGSALTYAAGVDLEYKVVGSDYYFRLNTMEKAGLQGVAFNGLFFTYYEWVTNVDEIRLVVR